MSRENPQQQPAGTEMQQTKQPMETAQRQPTQMSTQHGGQETRMSPQPMEANAQPTMGGQTKMRGAQTGGQAQMGQQLQQRLPPQTRTALTAIAEAIEVCEWCADQCVQEANPDMIECIRLCEDVSELGEATLALTSRQSRYGQSVAQAFLQAVQACMQECGRHQAPHCQECAQTLQRTAQQCEQLLQGAGAQSTR